LTQVKWWRWVMLNTLTEQDFQDNNSVYSTWTIPTKQPPLVAEVSANVWG
jgi:hypothetical protein